MHPNRSHYYSSFYSAVATVGAAADGIIVVKGLARAEDLPYKCQGHCLGRRCSRGLIHYSSAGSASTDQRGTPG